MRILMLAQFYAPITGGEERHVQDLSVALASRGHDVAVATLRQDGMAHFEYDRGVRLYRIKGAAQRIAGLFSEHERRHAPPLPDPETLWALRRLVAHEHPEIVHAHNWLVHSFWPLKRWSGAKLVETLHAYGLLCPQLRLMHHGVPCTGPGFAKCLGCAADHYGPAKGIVTALAHRVARTAERAAVDMFLTVSQAVAQGNHLIGSQLPYQVIPNFVADDIEVPLGDTDAYVSQLPEGDYLLFVGDLVRDKGLHVLLRAYAGLTQAPPLVLIGRRGADTPVEYPPNVMVFHNWPHGAVMEAWSRAQIGLVPSVVVEAFGIVALEAMIMGRPVIASRIGGLADLIVDGETGFLVQPGDAETLRPAMERLLGDAVLRERMGQAGKQKALAFKAGAIVPRIEQVYTDLLSRPA